MGSSVALRSRAVSDAAGAPASSASERFGFVTFSFHVWAVVALALSNVLLLVSICAAPFALKGRGRQELARLLRFDGLLEPLSFYVAVGLVSVAVSLDPRSSLSEADELLGLVSLLLALLWIRNERRVRWVLDGIVIMATGSAIWGLGQFFAGYGDLGQRIRGPFSHYMTFAGVLLLADLILVARFACRRPKLLDWRWAACAVITTAMLGSLTRSAWVALALALVVLALVRRPKSLLVWVPVGVVALALLATPVRERARSIVDLQNPSNYDRLSMLDAGLDMLAQRPFFGLGPGMAKRLYPIYRPLAAPRHTVPHLHNTYLQIAADSGLFGLGAYLWLIGAALWAAFTGYRDSRSRSARSGQVDMREELYLAAFLALLGFSLAGLFEANWLDTEVQRPLLFLLALPFLLRAAAAEGRSASEAVGE